VKSGLQAIVLKTSRFRETRDFFETIPEMKISESSPTHFVIHARGIRVLFVESAKGPEVELYLTDKSASAFRILEDPNKIKIVVS